MEETTRSTINVHYLDPWHTNEDAIISDIRKHSLTMQELASSTSRMLGRSVGLSSVLLHNFLLILPILPTTLHCDSECECPQPADRCRSLPRYPHGLGRDPDPNRFRTRSPEPHP